MLGWFSEEASLRFALEALDGVDVLRQLLLEDLDSHRAGKPRILRFVNHSHAARAERSNDVEMRDLATDHDASLSRVPGVERPAETSWPRARRSVKAPPPNDELSDSTLHVLERAQGGDELAAKILIERALPSVRRWARGRLPRYARSDADTEDVVQDAFLRTLRRIKRFQHRTVGGLQAYLRQAVVNRVRDLIRGSKRRGTGRASIRSRVIGSRLRWKRPSCGEQLDRFLEALRRLRPADRQVIVWRIELGYTADEIATKLGKSKAAAGMTVTRAMTRLAKEMNLEPALPK